MIIQIIGLPGSGKTTLAKELANRINAIHLNADEVRSDLSKDLGFTLGDRVEQARRLGAVSRILSNQGHHVVVDFVNPTKETRDAFGKSDRLIWMNTFEKTNYPDTEKMFEYPEIFHMCFDKTIPMKERIDIITEGFGLHDWSKPTTLMLGRYQPWHEGHNALYKEAQNRTEQVVVGVRNTHGTTEKDPLTFDEVKEHISKDSYMDNAMIIKMPNITNIVYGRDVGYKIEQVDLGAYIHAISATEKRKEMGI